MADTDYNGTLQGFVKDVAKGIKTAKHLGDGDSFAIYPSQFQEEISKLHDTSDVIIPHNVNTKKTDYILTGYNAYTAAGKLIGAMPDKENWSKTLEPDTEVTIPKGYHNGEGKVTARGIALGATTIIIDNETVWGEDGAITVTKPYDKDGLSEVIFKYSDENTTYIVNENDTAGLSDIRNYAYLKVSGVDRAETKLQFDSKKIGNDISNEIIVTASNIQDSGYLFPNSEVEVKTANLILSASGQYVYLKNGDTELAKQNVVSGTLANPIFDFDSNTAIVTATSKLTKAGYLSSTANTSNTFSVPKAERATNDVNIDRYAANDYEYVEIQVNNNQETGYVTGSNESTRVNIHAKEDTSGNFIVSTEDTANGEQEWYRINKSTASASGKTVTVPAGYIPSQQTVDVATVSRANTTISSLKDSDANTIILTASNNQGTGWVTGANKTASKVVSISANGATVTASDGTNSISKSVATVSRASTTVSATSDDTADTITVTGANNQGTGYVTGANKTASDTITLTQGTPSINTSTGVVTATSSMKDSVSSKSVSQSKTLNLTTKGATTITPTTSEQTAVAAGTYTTGAIKVAAIPGVTRANTTISVSANDTNDTLTVSASNNQSTGYVTGSNKTASTTITLTNSGKTVTATASDGTKISRNVATVTRADNTVNTQWEDYAYADTYGSVPWIQVHNDQGTGYVTGANKTSDIYVLAGANSNGAYEVKTVAGGATETWYTIGKSTASASGKTVTVPAGYVPSQQTVNVADGAYSASVSLTAGAGSTSATGNISLTAASAQPSTGYYIKATGSGTVSATGKATIGTAGYLATGNKSSSSSSKSSNTATQYYTIPTAAFEVSGNTVKTKSTGAGYVGASTTVGTISTTSRSAGNGSLTLTAGAGSAAATGTNFGLLGTATTTKPSSGSYLTVTGSGTVSGSGSGTVSTGTGYVTSGSTSSKTATGSKSSNTATVYYPITTSSASNLSVSGATVTTAAGFYPSAVSKSVASGEFGDTIIEISDSGEITATTEMLTAGYMSSGAYSTNSLQMTTKGATTYSPSTSASTIAKGTYLTGDITIAACSGTKNITSTSSTTVTGYRYAKVDDDDLVAGNIKKGVNILGVAGTYDPQPSTTTLTANPLWTSETYTPSGYDGYSSVTINAIPSIEFQIAPGNYIEAIITDANETQSGNSLYIPDYVDASVIKKGAEIFGVTGTYDNSFDFSDATLTDSWYLVEGQVAYGANGQKITGVCPLIMDDQSCTLDPGESREFNDALYYWGFTVSARPVSLQNVEVTPSTDEQDITCDGGYDGLGTVTVLPIPDDYIKPSGTVQLTSNGYHDVSSAKQAWVTVESGAWCDISNSRQEDLDFIGVYVTYIDSTGEEVEVTLGVGESTSIFGTVTSISLGYY